MADGDREYIGGWLVVEDSRFPWDCGLNDVGMRVAVCGEIGHVRWQLFQIAWREACRRDLDMQLREFAERWNIEYVPTQRRREAPHNDETESNS